MKNVRDGLSIFLLYDEQSKIYAFSDEIDVISVPPEKMTKQHLAQLEQMNWSYNELIASWCTGT